MNFGLVIPDGCDGDATAACVGTGLIALLSWIDRDGIGTRQQTGKSLQTGYYCDGVVIYLFHCFLRS